MVEPRTAARLSYRALYLLLALADLFQRLIPLSALPRGWPAPNILLCLTVLWVQRRPDYLPSFMVAAVFFLDDLMTMRPPGLWALIVLVGTEILRTREAGMRDLPFWGEWLAASLVMTAMTLTYQVVLTVFMVPGVSLGPVMLGLLATIALYPVLAFGLQWLAGLRRTATGEVDALGQRL